MEAENNNAVVEKFLKDYKEPDYKIDTVDLEFDLDKETTKVKSTMKIKSDYDRAEGVRPLKLDGDELDFVSIAIDGKLLDEKEYKLEKDGLTLLNPPAEFTLTINNNIHPEKNTALEGLYVSGGNFCTQCEPEGFRRITYYPDHPDVMAKFTTLIKADKGELPVLLSNGNPIEEGKLEDGRDYVKWEDPFPKPSYLFALVGGDLGHIEDKFITMSGREVKLGIYVEKGKESQASFAMEALKNSMKWDEEKWGREYDLDLFNIVAVSDFNQGAMENKGLNIFNDKYILADPKTATDLDYERIEAVIGHEYFHNWSGDRVTVKNWFNLSLKEGLTVFRDQDFSSDMRSRSVKRIDDVKALRTKQFPEDAGPLAAPVLPESFIEMNNFYTMTVYEKGSEIIGMTKSLLGEETFRKATDEYFSRYDGQAVTIDEWLDTIQDVSKIDLTQFKRWYTQAGTPNVQAVGKYDAKTKTYEVKLKQNTKPTPDGSPKEAFFMPMTIGLLDSKGNDMNLLLDGEGKDSSSTSKTVIFNQEEQTFKFVGVNEPPVMSLNRGFTAPIILDVKYTDAERALLMAKDSDSFNRWEAGQQYAKKIILGMVKDIQNGKEPEVNEQYLKSFGEYLTDKSIDKGFASYAMKLPSISNVASDMDVVDIDAVKKAHDKLSTTIAKTYEKEFYALYEASKSDVSYKPDPEQIEQRSYKNAALSYIGKIGDKKSNATLLEAFDNATNMTDEFMSLSTIVYCDAPFKDVALNKFYNKFKDYPLVIDKWLAIQASSDNADTLGNVKKLMEHEAFNIKNPNKVRSLLLFYATEGTETKGSLASFHAKDGSGYKFIAEQVKVLDDINPMTAAKLVKPLADWRKYDKERQELMKAALRDILSKPDLKKNSYEIASKALGDEMMSNNVKEAILKNKDEFIKSNSDAVKTFASKSDKVTDTVSGVKASGKKDVANQGLKNKLGKKLVVKTPRQDKPPMRNRNQPKGR